MAQHFKPCRVSSFPLEAVCRLLRRAEGAQTPLGQPSHSPCPFLVPTSAMRVQRRGQHPGLCGQAALPKGPGSCLYNSAGELWKFSIFHSPAFFTQVTESATRPALTTFPLLGEGERDVSHHTILYFQELHSCYNRALSEAPGPWGERRGGFPRFFRNRAGSQGPGGGRKPN